VEERQKTSAAQNLADIFARFLEPATVLIKPFSLAAFEKVGVDVRRL
jgi:hypothetical protein